MKLSQRERQSYISFYFVLFTLFPSLLLLHALLSSPPLSVSAKDLSGFHLFVRTLPLSPLVIFHPGKAQVQQTHSHGGVRVMFDRAQQTPDTSHHFSLHIRRNPQSPNPDLLSFLFILFFTSFSPHFSQLLSFHK